ncbi:MAG: hypothetical protein LBE82_13760 [Chitinophagaceae bacterium]|jgi:hypothetical protein|nr:hypothetical protein [Chitinophagaceae bacterium]
MKPAYHTEDVKARSIISQASSLFDEGKISAETLAKIKEKYKDKLYTPNLFIACAIALATIVAVLFCVTLYFLMFYVSIKTSDSNLSLKISYLILGGGFYFALEKLVKSYRFYNAGVDNILQITVLVFTFLFIAFNWTEGTSEWWEWGFLMVVPVAAWLCYRFYNALSACTGFASLIVFFIFFGGKQDGMIHVFLPFLIMIISIIAFVLTLAASKNSRFYFYAKTFTSLKAFSLITLYLAGNYFVINSLNDTSRVGGLLGAFFWLWTCAVPFVYLVYGIVKKDLLEIRVGSIIIAVAIFTIRNYYAVLPAEIAMMIAGIVLILISYLLIKFLSKPKRSFTSKKIGAGNAANIEALIIAQTFAKTGNNTTPSSSTTFEGFGGGSTGGGGAGGSY